MVLLASSASTNPYGVNFFSQEDCNKFSHTVSNPGYRNCAAVNPSGLSWEIVSPNPNGCTVHVYSDTGCNTRLEPPQYG
jgi:hypothetical protein